LAFGRATMRVLSTPKEDQGDAFTASSLFKLASKKCRRSYLRYDFCMGRDGVVAIIFKF
jgi:hypothetical protein